jgi:murein DD-endopeptidase MepM/ murein hydrolase activator NlpD
VSRYAVTTLLILLLLSSCAPLGQVVQPAANDVQVEDKAPAATATPSRDPAAPSATPSNTATLAPFPVSESNKTETPTPDQTEVARGDRPASYQAPVALRPEEHFFFDFPLPVDQLTYALPSSRYGDDQDSTIYGRGHTGLDLVVDVGTPVMAAGDGTVLWSGYGIFAGEEDFTDPYGIAITIRHDFGFQGGPLYSIYAHLSQSYVEIGQQVQAGEIIGLSGSTGYSSGPHLHFEVREGENNIRHTRNPELWLAPAEGWGVLAATVLNTYDKPIPNLEIYITSLDEDSPYSIVAYSYSSAFQIYPDDYYGENFVVSDLPAGRYEIAIPYVSSVLRAEVIIHSGTVTYFSLHGYRGFDFTRPEGEAIPANVPSEEAE